MLQPELLVPSFYIFAAACYALLGIHAWKKRPAAAVVSFAWMMLAMSIWSFFYGLEIFFPQLETKLSMVDVEYIGIIGVPIFLFIFAMEYTTRSHLLIRNIKLLIFGVGTFFLLLVWTNPLHHLMWNNETIKLQGGLILLDVHFRFTFWVHTFLSYGVVLTSNIMLIMELLQRPGVYRLRVSLVILGVLLSLTGSIIFVSGISPIKNLDLAPLFFLPNAIGMFWVTARYRLLDILPPEHLTVLKNMKDGVVVLNNQQQVLYINPVAETLFHKTENEVLGQSFEQVSGIYAQKLNPYLTGEERRAEIEVGAGKSERTFEVTISPVIPQQRESAETILSLHDITERKEVEEALSRREAIMSAINIAAEQFLRSPDWENHVQDVLSKIGQAANVSRVLIVTNSTEKNGTILSSLQYEWTKPGVASQINNPILQNISFTKKGFGRWQNVLSQGLPIYGSKNDFPQGEHELLNLMGSLSLAVIPIFADKQWWGFIVFDETNEEHPWNDMELDAFNAAANIIGAAVARIHAEQKVIQRQNTLSLLNEIVRVSLQAEDIHAMGQSVVDRLGGLVGVDGCYLTLWDTVNEKAIPFAAYGEHVGNYQNVKANPGERTFTQSALEFGHTLIVEDALFSPYISRSIAERFPAKSLIVIPLMATKKNLGAVILAFNTTHYFSQEEISVSEQAAALIALALEKFQALEDAKLRAIASENLRKASVAIAETLGSDHAIDQILEQLKLVVPYDSASVQLLEGSELRIVGGRGFPMEKEVMGMRFPIPGNNPNTIVIKTGKPYFMGNAPTKYDAFREKQNAHIVSWLGVPIIIQNRILGLLAIDSWEENDFSEEDAALASTYADQVAIVLENARIFKETQEQAIIDTLTQIYNRRGLLQLGEVLFESSKTSNRKFAAIMADIDRFKSVNDTYGHEAGDKVLQAVAAQCKSGIREIDLIGRYGGEEIVVLLPDTNLKAGIAVAERLRKGVENIAIEITTGIKIRVTVSVGVACIDNNISSLSDLIKRADQAMYIAKHHGRNRVEHSYD